VERRRVGARAVVGDPTPGAVQIRPVEESGAADREMTDAYDSLTMREREVLHLAAEGLTSAQIADRLSISPRTAETHRANSLRKLNIRGQTELVRYAIGRGILPAPI